MCTVLFAYRSHPGFRLVLASNRDEYYERDTEQAGYWKEEPAILAGRDVRWGGTWLGVTREGRFACITNFRDPSSTREHLLSRGLMVAEYLREKVDPEQYIQEVHLNRDRYNGFNLLAGNTENLLYYSNREGMPVKLQPGIYGLSNHLLDTPWPKVTRGKDLFLEVLNSERNPSAESLLRLLSDARRPPDNLLPETGVGVDLERVLSSIFITSPTYGTRASTVLIIDDNGRVVFTERVFNSPDDEGTEVKWGFKISF
jgi:uncharacterized protein with NRDE domain